MEIKKLISKFITNIFEKKYSDADKDLQGIVESKLKEKVENVSEKVKGDKNPFAKKDGKDMSKKDDKNKSSKKVKKNNFLKKITKKGN